MSPAGNVADPVARWAAETPWAPALIDPRQVVHWRALDRAVDHAALWLRRQGLAPGQRVGIALPPRAALYIVVVYALARLGAPAMLLPLAEATARRAELARRFGLVAVVGHGEPARLPGLPLLVPDPGWLATAAAPEAGAPRHPGGDDPWLICLSSGTTAAPKAMMRSHAIQHHIGAAGWRQTGGRPDDRLLAVIALHFVYGLTNALQALAGGAALRLPERSLAVLELAEMIDRERITRLVLTPEQVATMLDQLPGDAPRFPRLRDLKVSTAPLTPAMRQEVMRRIAPALSVTYGANECWMVCRADAAALAALPGTVGFAYEGVEIEIVDEAGRNLPVGTAGQVRVRGPTLVAGYLDDPAATARAFRDGWYYTGDYGRLSPEGALFLHGRVDDAINFDGIKVLPEEIEAVLLEHPAVAEAAAFPRRALASEVPAAAVVLCRPAEPAELIAFCRERLGMRAPRSLRVLERLPRNAIGKVLRRELAAAEEASPGSRTSSGAG
jgi:acyl-coenzyme A synthetase/AMP-(fatty) acid ligase